MYHAGNRDMQRWFGSTKLADRLLEKTHRTQFSEGDKTLIEGSTFFFLATADPNGRPDCSFKGGPAGFVRVISPDTLVFPDYDGNGMFKSLGNIKAHPYVGLLFLTMDAAPKRLRVNGKAEISFGDPMIRVFDGAQALVRVTAEHIFPNCPRYIPDLGGGVPSKYIPKKDTKSIEPAWKGFDEFKDIIPPRKA